MYQSSSLTPSYEAHSQLLEGTQIMATSAPLLQSQVIALEQTNEAMKIRRKKKWKTIQSDHALAVGELQALVAQDHDEADIVEDIPRPTKRVSKCSGRGQVSHSFGNL